MGRKGSIWFFTEDTSYTFGEKNKTRSWIRKIIHSEGFKPGNLNIIFCSDDYLHEINIKYLKNNTLTDIVTFNMSEEEGLIGGDIYISIERAKENAEKYAVKVRVEVLRLIAHGVLHLAGYEDKERQEKQIMTQKEEYYLSLPAN